MNRRKFLRSGAVALGAGLLRPRVARAAAPADARWRTFEVTSRAEIANPSGPVRVWLPLPLVPDTDYQRSLDQRASGNAPITRVHRDEKYNAGMFYAEWPAGEPAPAVEVTVRFATRDRFVDLSKPGTAAPEDKAVLARYTGATTYIPTDGIVARTSRDITRGASADVDKARAIYEWIVENTFRDPKIRGCGLGNIRAMLETGNLGGKCADLNALFVGLVRAAGIPARDVYGVRVADSAEFKSLGRSGDITKAQHCRAECYLSGFGWVPVDPADVRKVVLEEGGGVPLGGPIAQRARAKLFGAWGMNWLAFNYAADLRLIHSGGDPLAFFMYPQAETVDGRRDCLDPDAFRYTMTARELTS